MTVEQSWALRGRGVRSVVDRNWVTVCSLNTKGCIDIEQALASRAAV